MRPAGSAGRRGEAPAQLERLLAQGRVGVRERHALEPPVGLQQVDGAPVRHLGDREPRHPRQQLVGVEPAAQHLAAPRQEALRALRALVRRDVLDHVDRHAHLAAAVPDRVGLDRRPLLLAGRAHAEADDRLGRLLAGEGAPAGQIGEREGLAGLVEDLEAAEHLGGRRRLQRFGRVEAERPHRRLVRVDQAAVRRLRGHRVGHPAEHRLQLVAGRSAAAVRARPGLLVAARRRLTSGAQVRSHDRDRAAGSHRQRGGQMLRLGGRPERDRQRQREQRDDRGHDRARPDRRDQRPRREQHEHGPGTVQRDRHDASRRAAPQARSRRSPGRGSSPSICSREPNWREHTPVQPERNACRRTRTAGRRPGARRQRVSDDARRHQQLPGRGLDRRSGPLRAGPSGGDSRGLRRPASRASC